MEEQQDKGGRNRPGLSLHVPEPRFRPGDKVDYSFLDVTEPGAQPRPEETCAASDTWPLCTDLVRVLADDNRAHGPWNPRLEPERLRQFLREMALVRAFDNRMYRAQRQGKTSFYMKCTGEEATSIIATHAARFRGHDLPLLPPAGLPDRPRLSADRDGQPDIFEPG